MSNILSFTANININEKTDKQVVQIIDKLKDLGCEFDDVCIIKEKQCKDGVFRTYPPILLDSPLESQIKNIRNLYV